MNKKIYNLIIWGIYVLFLTGSGFFSDYLNAYKTSVPFSDMLLFLNKGEVQKLFIKNEHSFFGSLKNGQQFKSEGILSEFFLRKLDYAQKNHYTQYSIETTERKFIVSLFFSVFPFLFIFSLIYFFMKQLQIGQGGQAMSFGKFSIKAPTNNKKITFKDVAGIEECKSELEEIVEFLKYPKKFTKLGGKIPKGVLLIGAPGTGKTLLAKAVAGESGVPFFSVSGSDFVEMFVGVGASRIRDLFKQGKKKAPCIIFIDEIDAVGRQRGYGNSGGHDEREQTLNQLLVEMDGFEGNEGIIIIAATNRPDVLDPAILRPGRFDRRVTVPLPDLNGRKSILLVHTKNIPLEENINLDIVAKNTPGMSGADIANLINEAALIAAKKNNSKVGINDIEDAQEKILLGSERRNVIMDYTEYHKTAYHESGHAIIATLLPDIEDPVHKISIVPRGKALGVTIRFPLKDRYSISKKYLNDQICILMSGRIAEELIFNELSSGASDDFEKATSIARSMICSFGMSKNLGPIIYKKENNLNYSEQTAVKIDNEVKHIISTQYKRAKYILESNIKILHSVANTLIEYETINGYELQCLIQGKNFKTSQTNKKITVE